MQNSHKTASELQDFIISVYDSFESSLSPEKRIGVIFSYLLMQSNNLLDTINDPIGLDNESRESLIKELIFRGVKDDNLLVVLIINLFIKEDHKISETFPTFLTEIKEFEAQLIKKELPDLFDKVINDKLTSYHDSRIFYTISSDFSKFMVDFMSIKDGDSLYIPFNRLTPIFRHLPKGLTYTNSASSLYKGLTALMLKINDRVVFNDSQTPFQDYFTNDEAFDAIISIPPIDIQFDEPINYGNVKLRSHEESVLGLAFQTLNPDGRLLTILSEKAIKANRIHLSIRKKIIKDDLLDTVVLLPSGILSKNMSYNAKTVLILLKKNKERKNSTRFIDAKSINFNSKGSRYSFDSKLFTESLNNIHEEFIIDVSNEDIASSNFSFNPDVFLLRKFRETLKGVPLSDIASIIKGETNHGKKKESLINLSDLKGNKEDYLLSKLDVGEKWLPKKSKLISGSALLLGRVQWVFNPTFYNDPFDIAISRDITALKIDESKVDIEYLISELTSPSIKKQLSMMSKGRVFKRISEKDILSLVIKLPSIEEQKAKVKGFKEAILINKKEELEHFKKVHGLEKELKLQNSYLRHTLAGPVTNLKSMISNLSIILEKQIFDLYPAFKDIRVSEKHSHSLEQILEIIQRDINHVHKTVKRQLNTDNPFDGMEVTQINLYDYLERYVREKKESDIDYELILEIEDRLTDRKENSSLASGKNIYIEGNVEVLNVMFDNLLKNAARHGFKYSKYKKVVISALPYEMNRDSITLGVENTGKPFPPGFDYFLFSSKGYSFGLNSGDGTGGWLYSKAIEFLKADYEIVDQTYGEAYHESDLVTCFDIMLPVSEIK
jgi:type I restriction enzyme M protein